MLFMFVTRVVLIAIFTYAVYEIYHSLGELIDMYEEEAKKEKIRRMYKWSLNVAEKNMI